MDSSVRAACLLIADTGVPRGSTPARVFWNVYHGIAYFVSWIQGLTPWLPRYDLEAVLPADCSMLDHGFFRLWPHGPALFETVVAVRSG